VGPFAEAAPFGGADPAGREEAPTTVVAAVPFSSRTGPAEPTAAGDEDLFSSRTGDADAAGGVDTCSFMGRPRHVVHQQRSRLAVRTR
jgi:hypothetical protein